MLPTKAERIAALAKADDDDFRDAVEELFLGEHSPGPEDHEVFRSDELVERTKEALTTLIAICRADLRRAEVGSPAHNAATNDQAILSAERKKLGPAIKALRDKRRKDENPGLQRRAWEVLARWHPEDFIAIKRALREGKEPVRPGN